MRIAALIALCTALLASAWSSWANSLDLRDRTALAKLEDRPVVAALHHDGRLSAQELGGTADDFHFIDTILARLPASKVMELDKSDGILDIEIVDEGMTRGVYFLLQRLELLYRYRRTGVFNFSVLNISLAPSRSVINRNRSADRTVGRALSKIADTLRVPVFLAVGNDGPEPGFVNPWARTAGVIAATATDQSGKILYPEASRPASYSSAENWHLFAAWGMHTIGARDMRYPKTQKMLEDEKKIDLASFVGAQNVDFYSVRSGTSFASPMLMSAVCPLQQLVQHLKAVANATRSVDVVLDPFIRAVVDTSIDREHPAFRYRLADAQHKYGGIEYSISPDEKRRFSQAFSQLDLILDIRFDRDVVVEYLKSLARPVPNSDGAAGHGFISYEASVGFVKQAKLSDTIKLFADPQKPDRSNWTEELSAETDFTILPAEVADAIAAYCQNNDLVLALPLYP